MPPSAAPHTPTAPPSWRRQTDSRPLWIAVFCASALLHGVAFGCLHWWRLVQLQPTDSSSSGGGPLIVQLLDAPQGDFPASAKRSAKAVPSNLPEPERSTPPKPQNSPSPKPQNSPSPKPQNSPSPKPQNSPSPKPQNSPSPKPQNSTPSNQAGGSGNAGLQVAIAGARKSDHDLPTHLAKPLKWPMHQKIVLPLDPLLQLQIPNGPFYLEVGLSIDGQGNVMRKPLNSKDLSLIEGDCKCFTLPNLPPGYPKSDYVKIAETILNQMNLLDGAAFQPGIRDGQKTASDLILTFEIQLR